MDAGLKRALEAKVYAGERLSRADGTALYESDDLAWLGRLAHHQRTEINGDRVTFAVNRSLSLADAEPIRTLGDQPVTELHIVNTVQSGRPWHYYPAVLAELKAARPDVGLRGFDAADIRALEKISGRPAGDLLDELMQAGLDSLSGTGSGAEEDWARIHRLAHGKGMKTPAAMTYGGGGEIEHLMRLRELQDETGGFSTFVLQRSPDGAPAAALKNFAVSRLLFDNVPHVTSSAATHELSMAQLALNFGADELDAPADREDLLTLIWDAGFRPVERDSRYAVVREYDAAPRLADRRSEPQQVWA
jgi:aminodeoxyfutalosine synthase